ncbi:MAG: FlgD immunoglobulin-like domain containing protein [Streptosporangiaceae bacterium]
MWVVLAGVVSALVGATLAIGAAEGRNDLSASSSAAGPLFGVSASSTASLAQATAEFGHMPIFRVFYPGLPSPHAWTTGAPGVNKSAVIVSFNALPSSILSGADNAALSHFFDTAPAGHQIYYSYHPEPEVKIADGEFALSAYKAAWAHVVSLADAAHNPRLQSTLILTSWDLSPQSGRNWKDYLPVGGIISTLGWDDYPAGTVKDRNPQPTSPADFMAPEVAASKSVGLPFGFAEFALATPNGRPGWLSQVGNYLMNSGALFGTYFDSPGYAGMQLTDSSSIAAWRSVVARSGTDIPLTVNATAVPTPPARPAGLRITSLALAPATFAATGGNHATVSFTLNQGADITVCVLGKNGAVIREMARPTHAAGKVTLPYYGYDGNGRRDPAGSYPVLVVASNAHGSATAEAKLTITAP